MRSRVRALETLQDLTGVVHDVEVLLDTIQRRARDNKTLAKSAGHVVEILQDERRAAVRCVREMRLHQTGVDEEDQTHIA